MKEEKIRRINELYHKSKAEGLTEEEKKEQKILRQEYIESFRENLRGQLNNISIKEKDGTIVNLGEKYGKKEIRKRFLIGETGYRKNSEEKKVSGLQKGFAGCPVLQGRPLF